MISACAALLPIASLAAGPEPVGATDLPAVFKRVQEASHRRSFSGTFVVSAAGVLSSSRIVHLWDGRDQYERIETLDGQMRRLYRHNETVHVVWPTAQEASIQQIDPVPDFPTPLGRALPAGASAYSVQPQANDRIAGLEAQVVTLKPKDAYRYAQRWWLERETGLLLRADLLDERGEVLESAAFSELQMGSKVSALQLQQEMNRLDGYKVLRPILTRTDLEREGWGLAKPVPGFEAVSCVRRAPLTGVREALGTAPSASASASAPAAAGKPLLQAVFSDGLTHVSLFIEPYDPARHRSEALMTAGATHAMARRSGEWWITAVGDVPALTLKQLADALERRKP
ncbi:MAG: MucB/RseB C-terminal domain-containing protein [Burkholderiales bacterium]